MSLQSSLVIMLVLLVSGWHVTLPADTGAEPAYKDPSDISLEERRFVIQAGGRYQECLATELPQVQVPGNDPRQLADAAMFACQPVLLEFDEALEQRNFSPAFREQQLNRIQKQAVRGLIAQATHIAASRQQAPD